MYRLKRIRACGISKQFVGEYGFTLMELLIVIALGVFIISLVTPKAMKLYDRLSSKMIAMQIQGLAARSSYEAFIRQASCVLANVKRNDGKSRITITCDQKIIYDQLTENRYLENGKTWFYNSKGFLTAIDENNSSTESGTADQSDSKRQTF